MTVRREPELETVTAHDDLPELGVPVTIDEVQAHLQRLTDEMRRTFANRDMGKERNRWLYSYNPLTVELV